MQYEKDGNAIYEESFAMIRRESDLARFDELTEPVVVRMIHSCGQTDLPADVAHSPGFSRAAREALKAGAPIITDANMVAYGVTRARLPKDNEVICLIRDERVAPLAAELGTTRSAAAFELLRDRLEGSVVAIGNAPTALFHLLEMIAAGGPKPAAILGIPVGFVGAIESKVALAESNLGLEWLVVHGRRGGSAITAGALNALASDVEIIR
ncbi:precorrin-8X methylmutase [Nocardioides jejuensis]|uniref:Precorrin-8X methylmutase n=2 Tax=Nocardioides jejuensis TaxID=2502782 RepID=A0A4R1CFP0_9ACTN|nr:precorrin-8X methylmutase [Nocardioides jejuensis]